MSTETKTIGNISTFSRMDGMCQWNCSTKLMLR